jgi:hypothetical protein
VRKLYLICLGLGFGCLMLVETARAETFQLADGQTLSGDVVSFNENGLIVRLPEGKYSDRVAWTKFSQADLKRLAQSAKIAPFAEPFIEVSQQERIQKTEVDIKNPERRLARPEVHSLFGALFSSPVGLLVLLALYAANIFAAFEVSIFRAQPRLVVCGLAAIPGLGILSPIIFLSMPTRTDRNREPEASAEVTAAASQTFTVPGAAAAAPAREPASAAGSLRLSQAGAGHSTASLPVTQVFQRGAFTFNRRFFETKFPGFFAAIRRDVDKDMVLLFKMARGEWIAQRITRIASNDLHVQVQKGPVPEEVRIPFTEIQEIQLKHKDA